MAKKAAKKKVLRKVANKTAAPSTPIDVPPPPASLRQQFTFLQDLIDTPIGTRSLRSRYPVFALSLYASIGDLEQLASDALVDGPDDKDIDLCVIDLDRNSAYIVQSYVSDTWFRTNVGANKADDLLTGFSWLMHDDIEQIPTALRSRARDLQEAIQEQHIERVHLLFVHNGKDNTEINKALTTVAQSANKMTPSAITITARQLALESVQDLYDSVTRPIVVDEQIDIECDQFIDMSGPGWSAVLTTIAGRVLHDLYNEHGDALFSANIRGFLDQLGRRASINKSIQDTVTSDPESFWVYNNGITILTNWITKTKKGIRVRGLSIINGAQTTGVLGSSSEQNAAKTSVPCRFVVCNVKETVDKIISRNNTQNAIRPFDHRSNDQAQTALRNRFDHYGIRYMHRRVGSARATSETIQAESLAPFIAAFHGRFQDAIRRKRAIFEDRSVYQNVFRVDLRAEHAYLVQALADAVSLQKQLHVELYESEAANQTERRVYELMRHSPSKYFVVGVTGGVAEQILGRKIADAFAWCIKTDRVTPDRRRAIDAWQLALEAILPLIARTTEDDAYDAVRSTADLQRITNDVAGILQALKSQFDASFDPIRQLSEIA